MRYHTFGNTTYMIRREMNMPGSKAKTSFTLDQDLFARAEDLSHKLHMSRSEFYARAIDDFVRTLEENELKERINAAQLSLSDDARAEGQAVTEFLQRATAQTAGHDAW
jgi:predicted transcriptional regulator